MLRTVRQVVGFCTCWSWNAGRQRRRAAYSMPPMTRCLCSIRGIRLFAKILQGRLDDLSYWLDPWGMRQDDESLITKTANGSNINLTICWSNFVSACHDWLREPSRINDIAKDPQNEQKESKKQAVSGRGPTDWRLSRWTLALHSREYKKARPRPQTEQKECKSKVCQWQSCVAATGS